MATFKRAPKALEQMLARVLKQYYGELHDLTRETTNPLTFDLLMVHADLGSDGEPVGPPLKHHGRTAGAVIKAVPKADRALGRADVEIRFDGDYWEKITKEEQEALVDHELHHLVLVRQDGLAKRDDLGRYRFKMRDHDYEFGWFVEVAQRHGLASGEVQQANRMVQAHGQILFGFAELPAPELPGMAGEGNSLRVVPREDGAPENFPPGEGAPGRWMLWEQMSTVQHKAALKLWGDDIDRTHEFFVREDTDTATNHREITDATAGSADADATASSPAANEKPAPAPKRARAKAASKR
jgi:hypothetical protein